MSPGKYTVSANKLTITTFNIQVNSGMPDVSNSFCGFVGTNTQIYVNNLVVYACILSDKNKNPVSVDDAEKIYKSVFSCSVTRIYNSQSTIIEGIPSPNEDRSGYVYKFY